MIQSNQDTQSPGILIVFSSPSGGGKSSLKDNLLLRFPDLRYSVSATTRPPRPGEIDGVHYHFRTPEEFSAMIDRGELVEFMEVHGNFYGTPKKPMEDTLRDGKCVILDLDVYGKENFDKVYPQAVGILICPPNMEELERRLVARKSDKPESIRLRLHNASQELEFARSHGKYEYEVVNDDFNRALEELTRILSQDLKLRLGTAAIAHTDGDYSEEKNKP